MAVDGRDEVENSAVRSALVAELAHSTVPTCIMGCTLVGVASFAYASTGMSALLAAAIGGGLASMAKVALMQFQRRRPGLELPARAETNAWKAAHAAITSLVAASVGLTATAIFLQPDLSLQMLATGLIFGYCSGIVSRVGIRPKIALMAIVLAAVPPIVAAATWSDVPHHIIVVVFSIFLLGSFESVRHVHRTAVKHVGMKLAMAALAHKDPLTGLANRIGLRAAFRAINADDSVAVFCMDLDGFKTVNDRYGHAAGDALLRMVAARLVAVSAPDATVVRMGGDEFVILKPGLHRRSDLAARVEQIMECLHESFPLGDQEVTVGASVGCASSPFKPTDLDTLLTRADEESYRIKSIRRRGLPADRTVTVLRGHV
ncbi:diguanylate cyclase domain-containing protein [Methylobacterium sp. D48H]